MSYSSEKGKQLEKFVFNLIKSKGLDNRAHRTPGSGSGKEKADISTSLTILGRNANIEVKNQNTLAIPQWWKQTEKQTLGYGEPLLIFKLKGRPDESALCLITFETLLDLLVKLQGPKTINPDREFKWKLERLKNDINSLLKELT